MSSSSKPLNLMLFGPIHVPEGKGKGAGRLDRVALARQVFLVCALVTLLFGMSSLSSQQLDEAPHRSLEAIEDPRSSLHLRGKKALLSDGSKDPGNYAPVSCDDVLKHVKDGTLGVEDPNQGVLHGRQVERDPKFFVSLHKKEFDGTRWDVMVSGDYYERALSASFAQVLQDSPPGARVLDVGGNIGFFSLLSASNGPVTVDSFEPNPKNRLRFCESLNLNQWHNEYDQQYQSLSSTEASKVNLYSFGVGKEEGVFQFEESHNPGQGKFSMEQTTSGDGFHVITLDKFAKDRGWFDSRPDIALLKVDVEGLEYNVILGAMELIRAKLVRNIFMEVSARNPLEIEKNKPALKLLVEAGYKVHKIGGWRGPNKDFAVAPNDNLPEKIIEKTLEEKAKQLNVWWML